jgi:hypothetical protein
MKEKDIACQQLMMKKRHNIHPISLGVISGRGLTSNPWGTKSKEQRHRARTRTVHKCARAINLQPVHISV